MIKSVYLLCLFYKTLAENELLVRAAREEVTAICGKDFEIIGFGEHQCALAFSTDLGPAILAARFEKIRGEKLHLILVRVDSVVGGTSYPKAWTWFSRHLPRALPKS
jgi:hypothetical protein